VTDGRPAAVPPARTPAPTARPPARAARRTVAPGSRGPKAEAWFVLGWAVVWTLIGALVAASAHIAFPEIPTGSLFAMSMLFALVVGFSALSSARVIFPWFRTLPAAVRALLQVLVLISGTVFGSAIVVVMNPLVSLARPGTIALVILVNALLAVATGIALYTYDSMRHQIVQSFQLQRDKDAIERQLQLALEVQKELFPKTIPRVAGLQLAGVCLPAIGVGGDYYDFLPLGEDRVGLVVADVSGKGIPAALLMAGLQASVRGLVLPSLPAAEVNRRLNEVIYRSTSPSRYATLFFGVYDGRERTLTYSNAGHNPPILICENGPKRLDSGGIPLGVLGDVSYDQDKHSVAPGDILALYTDGVTESVDRSGREFGEDRLIDLLSRNRGRTLDEMIPIVIEELRNWTGGGPPHDDITLVLARCA